MAIDFLTPHFPADRPISQAGRRRAIVVKFLEGPDTPKPYRLRRNLMDGVLKELTREGFINVKPQDIYTDAQIYRNAYKYLQGKLDVSGKQITQTTMAGIRILKDAGIDKWEALKVNEKPATKEVAVTPPTIQVPPTTRKKLSEILNEASNHARMIEEVNVQLKTTADSLLIENRGLHSVVDTHAEDIKFRDELIYLLETQAKDAKVQQLEDLSKDFPEYPQNWNWPNESGTVQYMGHFLEGVARIQEGELNQAKGSIKLLCEHGPYGGSLQSKPIYHDIPHTPKGSFSSRVSDSVRFTWKKHGTVIVVYWIYNRGNSRIGMSEK